MITTEDTEEHTETQREYRGKSLKPTASMIARTRLANWHFDAVSEIRTGNPERTAKLLHFVQRLLCALLHSMAHRLCAFLHAMSRVFGGGLGGGSSLLGGLFRGLARVFSGGRGGVTGLLCRCFGGFAGIVSRGFHVRSSLAIREGSQRQQSRPDDQAELRLHLHGSSRELKDFFSCKVLSEDR